MSALYEKGASHILGWKYSVFASRAISFFTLLEIDTDKTSVPKDNPQHRELAK